MPEPQDLFESLLANPDFRDWVEKPTDERNQFWQAWLEAHPADRETVNRARMAVLKLRFKEDFLSDDKLEQMLNRIVAADVAPVQPARRRERTLWWAVAAMVCLSVVGVWYWSWEQVPQPAAVSMRTVSNPLGQKSRLKLPDGTLVNLNAGSTLTFPEKFTEDVRQVTLQGEAYFQVVHRTQQPFVLETGTLQIKVLGTTFNARAFADERAISISLIAGQVQVTHPTGNWNMLLQPGERLTFDERSGLPKKDSFDQELVAGWVSGLLIFDNVPFGEFVKRLEQWYGVQIVVSAAPSAQWRVNGRFDNDSLEEVLLGVQFTYGLDFQINGKQVTLTAR